MEDFRLFQSRRWDDFLVSFSGHGSLGLISSQPLELFAWFFASRWNVGGISFPGTGTLRRPGFQGLISHLFLLFAPHPERSAGGKKKNWRRRVLSSVFGCVSNLFPSLPFSGGTQAPRGDSRPFGAMGAEGRAGSRRRNDDAPRAPPAYAKAPAWRARFQVMVDFRWGWRDACGDVRGTSAETRSRQHDSHGVRG